MSLCVRLHSSLVVLSLLTPSTRLLAQQYCVSGSVTETHLGDLRIGDPIRFTAQVQSGSQSCTTNAGQTTCSAIVLLEIKSGTRRWSSAMLNSKAATIQFIFSARDTTTRVILGAVVGQSSPPQALTPFNMLGVHIDLGTYSGNFLANGGFPSTLPSISNRPFEPASIYLAGPGGNTTISYTGQDCGGISPIGPAPGDIVLYRSPGENFYTHVAVIAPDGIDADNVTVIRVISKWGRCGLYAHDPDDSPYGKDWTVWHTKRAGFNGNKNLLELDPNSEYYTDLRHHIVKQGSRPPLSEEACTQINNNFCANWTESGIQKLAGASPVYDCRGFVFDSSTTNIQVQMFLKWVWSDPIEIIRTDNGYVQVTTARPSGGKCRPKPLIK